MSSLADLAAAVADLNARYPRPAMAPVAVSEPWSIPDDWTVKSFPNADHPGVYVFFGEGDVVLYIGKASAGLGQRIGQEYVGRNGLKSDKVSGAVTLRTIMVPKDRFFEAPAIEEFLIDRLKPPRNTCGK